MANISQSIEDQIYLRDLTLIRVRVPQNTFTWFIGFRFLAQGLAKKKIPEFSTLCYELLAHKEFPRVGSLASSRTQKTLDN